MSGVAYPPNLTSFVLEQWPKGVPLTLSREQLDEVLSVCFLASLTTEEGRPVRFRLLLTPPSALPEDGSPNHGALRLRFTVSRPFDADELRRLSPAVPFETALIGAYPEEGRMRIWGMAHSGAAWLAPTWGGRSAGANWTVAPIIHVGPGRLAVRAASQLIAGLERGELISSAMDVFESEWLPRLFAHERETMRQVHRSVLAQQPGDTNDIDDSLPLIVSQHMLRRVIRVIRGAGHGGMILFTEADDPIEGRSGPLRLKYTFTDEEPQRRYQTLLGALTTSLAAASAKGSIGWEDYRDAADPGLAEVETQIFELSRLVASLAATDGAVLMNKRLAILGFGVEVSAELPAPLAVWRALDMEGTQRTCDAAESVGTRHRAAYRFVQSHPGGLAVVISHDGAVRFVAWRDDGVTYWEHAVTL